MPLFFTDRTSTSLYVRSTHADGSVTVTAPVPVTIVPQNAGIFRRAGEDPRPGLIYHYSNVAMDAITVSGTIFAGNTGTILSDPTRTLTRSIPLTTRLRSRTHSSI